MKYESLLLDCGGGVTGSAARAPQFSGSALCIGIGGTGIAALSALKGKIYQRLTPDNPGDPVPRYDAIQLLGIDSDDYGYRQYSGNRRLIDAEFISIKQDNLHGFFTTPQGKQLIKSDPVMNWMDIHKINCVLSPEGSGCIRQMGRYLLLSKAASLYTQILQKCRLATNTRDSKALDIHIFAGLSGGTGSGCFLDTCYLVRKVAEDYGFNARIMGYFFLPDVITGKPEVGCNPTTVANNHSNGYAALKELDYLMNLEHANDWFEQTYGQGIQIRTQMPPVDMCCLISAQNSDGSLIPNGYHYSINLSADFVLGYLTEQMQGDMIIRGHLAKATRGVYAIPRRWGANLSYHILGTCNAEIPTTQINTYLACGFFRRFAHKVSVSRNLVNRDAVLALMKELRLRANDVRNDLADNIRALQLPQIDWKQLACEPVAPKGRLPRIWADHYNNWMAESEGIICVNIRGLTRKPDCFDDQNVDPNSLIGRLFCKLWSLCVDPAYGPYYAAYLLKNNGNDLLSALMGEIAEACHQEDVRRVLLADMENQVVECNEKLVNASVFKKKRAYTDYDYSVTDYLNQRMAYLLVHKTVDVLKVFRAQVEELYNTFFGPLVQMLDNLQETFRDNEAWLKSDAADGSRENTVWLVSLGETEPRLDRALANLDDEQLVTVFMQELLGHSADWLHDDEHKIAARISNYMLNLFKQEASRSLQDYLFDKYPQTQGDINSLIKEIEDDILNRVHRSAIPMFWCDPTYRISDPGFTFESSSLSVPSSCSAICSASNNFQTSHPNYTVRQTGIEDRIFALRFVSGIPLFAYQGIHRLKADYDAFANKAAGSGAHLYAATGSGSCRDWRTWLPDPVPVSRRERTQDIAPADTKAVELYHRAVESGVIVQCDPIGGRSEYDWGVCVTPPLKDTDLQPEGFAGGKVPPFDCYEWISLLEERLRTMHLFGVNPDCRLERLLNDGDPELSNTEVVRIDHFVRFPVLQELAQEELHKRRILEERLQSLQELIRN